jgi:hypothetical protein
MVSCLDLSNRIADPNETGLNDLGIYTPQLELLAGGRVHKPGGIRAETLSELLAARVRQGGDLD